MKGPKGWGTVYVDVYEHGCIRVCVCMHLKHVYVLVFTRVSVEESQPGLDLERASLRLGLVLVEHRGKGEVEMSRYGRMLQA